MQPGAGVEVMIQHIRRLQMNLKQEERLSRAETDRPAAEAIPPLGGIYDCRSV